MTYRLHVDEALSEAVRRSAVEELSTAARGLAAGGSRAARDEAVHEARKSIKKTRSLLRLVRGAVKKGARREENALLREAAGRLAAQRDAAVLVATARKLPTADIPQRSLDTLQQRLVCRRREATLLTANQTDPAAGVSATLTDAARRLAQLPLSRDGFDAVLPGLDRAYRRGHTGSSLPLDADGEAWHEWRKHAKDLRYHLEWLSPLWPAPLGAVAAELHTLTDLLGDEHDLAVLTQTLTEEHERFRDLADLDRVDAAVAARRRELRASALDLGARCYAETRKAFVARLEVYWRAGRERGADTAASA